MARTDMPDYYAILGVEKSATDSDVKRAYRQLSRTAHPDAGGNPALFQMITLAYNTLKDPGSRKEYDTALSSPSKGGYAEEDLKEALTEQERILRAQWEAEARIWSAQTPPPPHPVHQGPQQEARAAAPSAASNVPDPEAVRYFRRLRASGYVLTGALFLSAYLLRAFGLLAFLDPGEGFLHSSTEFFQGVEPVLLLAAVGLGVAVEHFLAPSLRVLTTGSPWARRFAGAALVWIILLAEYLSTRPGQVLAVLGTFLCMSSLLLPRSWRERMAISRSRVLNRFKLPSRRH